MVGSVQGSVPVTGPDGGAVTSAAPRGGLLRAGARFARQAAIGVLLLMTVPIAVVSTRGDAVWSDNTGVRERLAEAERLRPLMAPRDAAITPMEAGVAFRALQSTRMDAGSPNAVAATAGFPLRVVPTSNAPVWPEREITAAMFPGLIGPGFRGPMSTRIIERAQRAFSPEELAYLRSVAESPVWRDFDRVAHAAEVDLIGGQYVLPFREGASALAMPMPRYAGIRELASAGVSRAAYYVAIGEPERGEAALRSVVSFGFAMLDNGSTYMDALIGRVIIGIGRDGLRQWSETTHDAGGLALTAKTPKHEPFAHGGGRRAFDVDAARARLLADANDPRVPRSARFESLRQLSLATCGSARGMLLGPATDIDAAFGGARSGLARYPSEQAYLDLLDDAASRFPTENVGRISPSDRLMVGAATVAGMVLNNPRVAACTRMVLAHD